MSDGPPLTPGADEGRSLLRRELLDPAYQQDNPVLRAIDWLLQRLDDGARVAASAPPLATAAAALLVLALVAGAVWLVSRARPSARVRTVPAAVLAGETLTAAQLRARAEEALAAGLGSEALVDGFRALAQRQAERGLLADLPAATAHEVAIRLAGARPDRAERLRRAADLFDSVLYGGRDASPAQARAVLDLDDDLGAAVGVR